MYEYVKKCLPNGLRTLLINMPHIHSFVAAAYVGVGSRYEDDTQCGVSHLLEHMLFRGPRHFKTSIDLLRAVDDMGGEAEAYTSPEYSTYLLRAHKKHAPRALEILADILLGARFREEDLATEKQVIQEEITHFKDASGDYISIDDLSYNLMWKDSPRRRISFGSEETIGAFTLVQLSGHYEKYYVPSNIVLCLGGNFDGDAMGQLTEELFGGLAGGEIQPVATSENQQAAPRTFFQHAHSQMVYFKLCHKAYSYKHPDLVPMLLIADVLGGGISSRLLSNVREKMGLVYEISSFPTLFSDVGSVDIYSSTSGTNVVKTIEAVMGEVDQLRTKGISEEELRRTEERVFTQMQLVMDNPLDMANWFGVEELLIRPETPDTPESQAEKVRNVNLKQVAKVIEDVFVPQRRNVVVVGPCNWWRKKRVKKSVA